MSGFGILPGLACLHALDALPQSGQNRLKRHSAARRKVGLAPFQGFKPTCGSRAWRDVVMIHSGRVAHRHPRQKHDLSALCNDLPKSPRRPGALLEGLDTALRQVPAPAHRCGASETAPLLCRDCPHFP